VHSSSVKDRRSQRKRRKGVGGPKARSGELHQATDEEDSSTRGAAIWVGRSTGGGHTCWTTLNRPLASLRSFGTLQVLDSSRTTPTLRPGRWRTNIPPFGPTSSRRLLPLSRFLLDRCPPCRRPLPPAQLPAVSVIDAKSAISTSAFPLRLSLFSRAGSESTAGRVRRAAALRVTALSLQKLCRAPPLSEIAEGAAQTGSIPCNLDPRR